MRVGWECGVTWLCVVPTGLQGIGSVLGVSHGASARVHTKNLRGAGPPPVKDLSVQDITRWDEDW